MAPHGLCHWLLLATLGKAYFLIRTRSSSRVICCHSHTRVKSNAAPPLVTTAVKEWQPHCGFSMLGSRDYSKDMFIWPVFRMGELQEDCQMFATTAFFCGVGCAVDNVHFFLFWQIWVLLRAFIIHIASTSLDLRAALSIAGCEGRNTTERAPVVLLTLERGTCSLSVQDEAGTPTKVTFKTVSLKYIITIDFESFA